MYYTRYNAKEINAEEQAYQQWESEQKSRILSMYNVNKKQAAWNRLFPHVEHDPTWELKCKIF